MPPVALTVTPVYALPLAVLFMALTAHVIRYRRAHRVPFGDAGDADLRGRVRAQANFTEYAPLGLLLLLIAELAGTAALWLHLIGACLLAGRLVHGWHLAFRPTAYGLRPVAVSLSFAAFGLAAILPLV